MRYLLPESINAESFERTKKFIDKVHELHNGNFTKEHLYALYESGFLECKVEANRLSADYCYTKSLFWLKVVRWGLISYLLCSIILIVLSFINPLK